MAPERSRLKSQLIVPLFWEGVPVHSETRICAFVSSG